MRPGVAAFAADGPLPDEADATEEELDRRVGRLDAIRWPVSRGEAEALAQCFGPDNCYGLAWSLLHLIETGPNPIVLAPTTTCGGT